MSEADNDTDSVAFIEYVQVTIFTLSIQTPQLLTIFVLKFEQVKFTTQCYLKISRWVANSVDPDETPHSVASHLGLHCLLRPVCQLTYGKYSILGLACLYMAYWPFFFFFFFFELKILWFRLVCKPQLRGMFICSFLLVNENKQCWYSLKLPIAPDKVLFSTKKLLLVFCAKTYVVDYHEKCPTFFIVFWGFFCFCFFCGGNPKEYLWLTDKYDIVYFWLKKKNH